MNLPHPATITHPLQTRIIELEAHYKKSMAEGKMFADMKLLKVEIRMLKAELSTTRLHENSMRVCSKLMAEIRQR